MRGIIEIREGVWKGKEGEKQKDVYSPNDDDGDDDGDGYGYGDSNGDDACYLKKEQGKK